VPSRSVYYDSAAMAAVALLLLLDSHCKLMIMLDCMAEEAVSCGLANGRTCSPLRRCEREESDSRTMNENSANLGRSSQVRL
jgi:hypothetical protein